MNTAAHKKFGWFPRRMSLQKLKLLYLGLGKGLISLSRKTLLLQTPEAQGIHVIKGMLWWVLTLTRTIAANPEKRKHFMEAVRATRHKMTGEVRKVNKLIVNTTFYMNLPSTFG